jgi:hypothetical protein
MDLTQIFVQAADNPSYLEASAASVVVAAAEVVAALNGSPSKGVCRQNLSNGRRIDRRPLQNSKLWHFEPWNVCGRILN